MEIRLFDLNSDYDAIRNWITDERTHMLWCSVAKGSLQHDHYPLI